MNIQHIQVDHILWIEVNPGSDCNYIVWREGSPEVRGWFGIKRRARAAGFYDCGSIVTEESLLKKTELRVDFEKKKIYNRPFIKIYVEMGKSYNSFIFYFDTFEEAKEEAERLTEKFPHITVQQK